MTNMPVRGVQPPPHLGLRALEPLVGDWDVQPVVQGNPIGTGRTRVEWTESGALLIQHSDADVPADAPRGWIANSPMPATCIIGLDDASGVFTMLYADSRSVSRVYQMTLADGRWTIWRDAPGFFQRYTATISEDGRTISGAWEQSPEGQTWSHDFDLNYLRRER
jgi:hypothetical protein